jgi:hypothetical protein
MKEEINDLCHKLLVEWCPKGFLVDGNHLKFIFSDGSGPWDVGQMWATGVDGNVHFDINQGGFLTRSCLFPGTIHGISVTVDLSEPKSTDFLKEAVVNLRREEEK